MKKSNLSPNTLILPAMFTAALSGTAAQRAETAADAAAASAELAKQRSYGVSVSENTLVFSAIEEQDGDET